MKITVTGFTWTDTNVDRRQNLAVLKGALMIIN